MCLHNAVARILQDNYAWEVEFYSYSCSKIGCDTSWPYVNKYETYSNINILIGKEIERKKIFQMFSHHYGGKPTQGHTKNSFDRQTYTRDETENLKRPYKNDRGNAFEGDEGKGLMGVGLS